MNNKVALQTFRTWAFGENKFGYIRGVLDCRSQQKTFIREDVSKTLNLRDQGRKEKRGELASYATPLTCN